MIIVTGSTGLVGSHLLYRLVESREKVRAIKRKNSNTANVLKVFKYYSADAEKLFNSVEWIDADITDPVSINEAFEGIDRVYHCAALISYNSRDRQQLFDNNVVGTENIVNACLKNNVNKLCYASSIAAIGNSTAGEMIDENTTWNYFLNKSGYSVSKYFAEQEVWRGVAEGLNAVIVNPTIILGPGHWDKGSSLFFKKIWKGFPFYTNGVNGFVDVRDVCSSMIYLMNSDISSERFILNSENLSYREFFEMISTRLGVKPARFEVKPGISSIGWRLGELAAFLGFNPAVTKETYQSAIKKSFYNNNKIVEKTGIKFIPVKEAIEHTGKLFLSEQKK